jgi:hypothetical protein
VGKQDFPGFFGRFGRAEQITLHFGAAESPQQLLLPQGFDAFRLCNSKINNLGGFSETTYKRLYNSTINPFR